MNERSGRPPQHALAAAVHCDPQHCPDADTLLAFADGALAEAERARVAVLVAACAGCAAAVRVALDARVWADALAAELAPMLEARPIPTRLVTGNVLVGDFAGSVRAAASPPARQPGLSRFRRPPLILAVAASGMLMVFAAALLLRTPRVDDTLRGVAVIAISPIDGTLLPRAPEILRWPCESAPTAATVELLAANATPRWSGPADACAAVLPEATRAALAPGEYLWRVRNAAGEPVLGPFGFRITP